MSSIPCRPARGLEKSGGIEIWQAVLKRQPPSRSSCPMMMHRADLPRRESRDSGPRHVTRTSKTFRDTTSPPLFFPLLSLSLSLSSFLFLPFVFEPNNPRISDLTHLSILSFHPCAAHRAAFAFCEFAFANVQNCTELQLLLIDFLSYLNGKRRSFPFFSFFLFSMFVRKYKEGRSKKSLKF